MSPLLSRLFALAAVFLLQLSNSNLQRYAFLKSFVW